MISSRDSEARRIGDKVRRARRARGMSLEILAGLAGRSTGWLSQIERGLRPLERRSDIAALASALRVSPTDLLAVELPPPIAGEAEGIGQLRELLHNTAIDDPPDVSARPLRALADVAIGPLASYRRDSDYVRVARDVPPILAELHVHAAAGDECDRVGALRLIVDLSTAATFAARHLGSVDLAWIAADRARQAAGLLEDPVYEGAAWFARAHAQPTAGQARPLRRAATAAERIQPHLGQDVRAHQVYGMLHLTAALGAQVQGDDDTAREHLDEAERIAAEMGERPDAWQVFGPANVGTWRTMLEVEAGRPDKALAVVATIDPTPLSKGRRAALAMETARAHAMLGRNHEGQTVQSLREAERLAPERVHRTPLVRELVADMLDHAHRTAGGRDLRGLAHRMGISA
jgi:transcriptional regulator with XRE-family HTH domain